ncbi:hypothetical protein ACXIT0_07060 [Methylorubrum extorquens]
MSNNKNFLTRKEVQAQTGWSLSFIDRRLPRIKVGGKVLIPASDLARVLKGERIDG